CGGRRCICRSCGATAPRRSRIEYTSARGANPASAARLPQGRNSEMVADHQGGQHQGGMSRQGTSSGPTEGGKNTELKFCRLVNPAKDTTHVIAEMGTHHAGGVAGCGALWLYWSRRRERGCCPHPILYLPRHISRPARPRPSGGESRARTLTQRALPIRQRP